MSAPTLTEIKRPVFAEIERPRPNRRVWWVIGGLIAACVIAGAVLVFLLVRDPAPPPVANATPDAEPDALADRFAEPVSVALAHAATPPWRACRATSTSGSGRAGSARATPNRPSGATARVRCELPGGFPVVYTRFERRAALRAYFATLSRDGKPEDLGRCAAEGEWFGDDDKVAGRLIGRRDGSRVVLSWSDDAERVAAFARAARSDRADLCTLLGDVRLR